MNNTQRAEKGRRLARNALEMLGKLNDPPYSSYTYTQADEDIVNEVYETIRNHEILYKAYKNIAQYHSNNGKYGGKEGESSLNSSISYFVIEITKGINTKIVGYCKEGGFAKTYTKLKW